MPQNKSRSTHWNVLKTNNKDDKGEENAGEDPTLDEYHNMKGKKEDDDSRPKPINESTRVNHFANLLVHVELEQLSNCSRIQPESVKEEGRA